MADILELIKRLIQFPTPSFSPCLGGTGASFRFQCYIIIIRR